MCWPTRRSPFCLRTGSRDFLVRICCCSLGTSLCPEAPFPTACLLLPRPPQPSAVPRTAGVPGRLDCIAAPCSQAEDGRLIRATRFPHIEITVHLFSRPVSRLTARGGLDLAFEVIALRFARLLEFSSSLPALAWASLRVSPPWVRC